MSFIAWGCSAWIAHRARPRAALCEAFGGEGWRDLATVERVRRLQIAKPPRGATGQRRPRYAALCAGGVLECVVALGFDDAMDATDALDAHDRVACLSEALRRRGYVEGAAAAGPLLARRRRAPAPLDDGMSTWLSRADALALSSPAGGPAAAAVVVRILANRDGRHGAEAAAAFVDALGSASICVYAGHGRYGIGADFEPGLAIDISAGASLPAGSRCLVRHAVREARRCGLTLEAILDRWLAAGWIRIGRSGASRVVFNPHPKGPMRRNPTARLVHWIASRAAGGCAPVTGPGGVLAATTPLVPHRVWLLWSCRSSGLFPAIRSTPGLGPTALRLIGCTGDARPEDLGKLPWVLDALGADRTWEELLRAIDPRADRLGQAAQARLVIDGWEEDPTIP